jgi:hypothetical protein
MIRITIPRLGPVKVTAASANMMVGNERTVSNSRSSALSSQRGP